MNNPLKIGVIGLGMGRTHIQNFKKDPRVTVVAAVDLDEKKLQEAKAEFGLKCVFTNASEMLSSGLLDAVSIAVPNKYHKPLAIEALKADLHVLAEKPMAMNLVEAQAIQHAAIASKKNFMINFSHRYDPTIQSLKAQVKAGVLGNIYYGRTVWHRRRGIPGFGGWFGNKSLSGGGPLIDLGVHRIDMAMYLMDYPNPISVYGVTFDPIAKCEAIKQNKHFSVEDCAAGMVRFENGATLMVEASWALNQKEPEHMLTQLYGTQGGLLQRNIGGGYKYEAEIYLESQGCHFTQSIDIHANHESSSYKEFIDSIIEKREPTAPAEHGIRIQKILDGLYQSAENGCEFRF